MKIIPLTRGCITYVDDEDYDELSRYRWHLETTGYARRNVWLRGQNRNSGVFMHRQIMGEPQGKQIDHINGNKLDNRRVNLRICERRAQNMYNVGKRTGEWTSQYVGVSWSKDKGKWVAQITVGGDNRCLGHFESEKSAALAYDRAARGRDAEFYYLNFPDVEDYTDVPKPRPQSTSGYYGVYWYKAYGLWAAQFAVNRRTLFVGYFSDPEEAARERERQAKNTPGFRGKLNFAGESLWDA